jgi:hypothetical protein
MTATKVGTRTVIATEPVESPLSTPNKAIMFTRIVKLLLDDESTTYGCTECEFTRDNPWAIRPHLRVHNAPKAKVAAPLTGARAADFGDMSVADLLGSVRQIEAISEALESVSRDRNEWRTRAMKAERSLATLRKLLGGES